MSPRGDRRGDQAARRLRAALRQALRGQEEGPRRRPFTVESLSPHRSLAFAGGRCATESQRETEAAKDADAPNFEQSILDNLAKAGIQNGRRKERIEFAAFETYAGEYIQAIGERDGEADGDAPSRIAIAIGPQYGTVSPSFVKNAAREAIDAEDVDLLCDPRLRLRPAGHRRHRGRRRHRRGLRRGLRQRRGRPQARPDPGADGADERRPADGRGAQEDRRRQPLHRLRRARHRHRRDRRTACVVDLKGVDVYDPTTGEVRSNDTDQIALWMIDTDYNEESFFVRHCYFTGGNDPYKRLKTALKADIDADAWESLYRDRLPPVPEARDRQDRRQGHQRLRRRGHEGLRGLTAGSRGRAA